jgi:hypothetical protein
MSNGQLGEQHWPSEEGSIAMIVADGVLTGRFVAASAPGAGSR